MLGRIGRYWQVCENRTASGAFVEIHRPYPCSPAAMAGPAGAKGQPLQVWPEFTVEECRHLATDQSQRWRHYLETSSEADLAKSVSYRNSKGETWRSRKDDILMHVVMHSAYHRGQIAADMRSAGLIPAYTDFIHSVRQGFVE